MTPASLHFPPARSSPRGSSGWKAVGAGLVLFALVVLAYVTVFRAGWLWDDDAHVTANATIVGPLGFKAIWTSSEANYFPLVLTTFWLQHAAWGVNPAGYHAVTLLFHAGCAVLLWRVLRRLRIPGAWLGAALWALHPVQVESVAWICELKNTQSGFFFLLAILFFVRWLEGRENPTEPSRLRGAFWLTLICAIAALMSKPSTVMLPAALVLIYWWRGGRISVRGLWPLAPFFVLSALMAGWTIWEQKVHSGATGAEWNQTLAERLIIAGRASWFYLGKLLWPQPLIFIYPRWTINAAAALQWLPIAAVVATLGALVVSRLAWTRHALFTLLYFGVMLFPILGFFSVYFFRYSFVGDHFQYLASMGPLALAGAGLALARERLTAQLQRAFSVLTAGLVVILAVLTWRYSHTFLSYETLWKSTLALNPSCTMAWINLAGDYAKLQRYDEAVVAYRQALLLNPAAADVYNDMAGSLFLMKKADAASDAYRRALALRPDYPDAHTGLGNALHALGKRAEARAEYAEALRLDPEYSQAHNNLATDLVETGEFTAAIAHYDAALLYQPTDSYARENLQRTLVTQGKALASAGNPAEAVAVFERAVKLAPGSAAALGNLATTLALAGRWLEAARIWQQVIALSPNDVPARRQLAVALVNADKLEEAVPQFEAAIRLDPASPETHHQFGQVLDVLGRNAEAKAQFEEADLRSRATVAP